MKVIEDPRQTLHPARVLSDSILEIFLGYMDDRVYRGMGQGAWRQKTSLALY